MDENRAEGYFDKLRLIISEIGVHVNENVIRPTVSVGVYIGEEKR